LAAGGDVVRAVQQLFQDVAANVQPAPNQNNNNNDNPPDIERLD
jgi:hypothetical protein